MSGNNVFTEYSADMECSAAAGVNSPLPLKIFDITYKELKTVRSEAAIKRSRAAAREAAYYDACAQMPEEVELLAVYCTFSENGGETKAYVTAIAKENIATEKINMITYE